MINGNRKTTGQGLLRTFHLFRFAPEAAVTFESLIQRIHPDEREGVERAVRRAVVDRVRV